MGGSCIVVGIVGSVVVGAVSDDLHMVVVRMINSTIVSNTSLILP